MLITLTTDFGDSEYVGSMKGVIAAMTPDAHVIDLTHGIRRHSIRHGAYALMTAVPHFPFAVHVAVVDPGVGTERKALAIACEGAYLVGPDNGVLIPAARKLGMKEVRRIENRALMRPSLSPTFHGRDVFAPLAAHLAAGIKFRDVGPAVTEWVDLDWGEAKWTDARLEAQVICTDRFGNVITNVSSESWSRRAQVGESFELSVGGVSRRLRFVGTYADADPQALVAVVGSGGYLEIAVNRGSAEDALRIQEGAALVLVTLPTPHRGND